MGNPGSKEFAFAREGDDFIHTGDGVRLSSSLIRTMTIENENTPKPKQNDTNFSEEPTNKNNAKQTTSIAKEYQALLEAREKEIARLVEVGNMERAKNDMFYKLTVDEFAKAAQDVEQKFIKPTLKPVCEPLQSSLLNCYKNNPQKILDCSKDLQKFKDCVSYRKEALLKSGTTG